MDVVLEFDPASLSLPRPPARVSLSMDQRDSTWHLSIRVEDPRAIESLQRWSLALGARSAEASGRRLVHAEFATLPPFWGALLAAGHERQIDLSPDHRGRLLVKGERSGVQQLLAQIRDEGGSIEVRRVAPPPAIGRLLTAPQAQALKKAADLGYYEIPRGVNLQGLSRTMGTSAAALSERLRRAEARVILRYLEQEALQERQEGPASRSPSVPA